MFNLKISWLSSIVLISLSGCLCSFAPPSIRVLSPSEFEVILAPGENGTLLDVRININRGFDSGEPDYRKRDVTGRVIHFSESGLKLKRGDIIYYSLTFDDGGQGLHGQDGNYIFDGVYQRRDRRRREIYEPSSEENSEEKSVSQNSASEETRYLRHGPPHGHFNPHGPHHRHHYGPHHFFPPPFDVPHHPPQFAGPDSWKGHGYDRGHNGPWDEHDDSDCDSFGHKPKYPGEDHRPDNRKPWHRPGDHPYPDNNDGSNNNGSGKPFGDKPNKGTGSGTDSPKGSDGSVYSGKNDNNSSSTTENPNVEVFTTRTTSTTARTTTVPDIDIRFRLPEDS